MAVFRVERTGNYTVMSNHHLRDKTLSLKAKGLLSLMLSLPEDWDYTLSGLARINAEGKDAIRAAVVELERAGYVRRRQTTDRSGKFRANEYVIREYPDSVREPVQEPAPVREPAPVQEPAPVREPTPAQESASAAPEARFSARPSPEKPATANPPADSTAAEKPTQLNKDLQNTENKRTDLQNKEFLPSLPFPPVAERDSVPEAVPALEAREASRIQKPPLRKGEMDAYRDLIRENIGYEAFVKDRPWDAGQLDEMVELMVEAVCSRRSSIRVAGTELPQAAVAARLLKLEEDHIRYVFDCLRENTTQVRCVKQYLLTVLYNAPATIENHYAARVGHDLGV